MSIKRVLAFGALLLVTASCAGLAGHSDGNEVTVIAGTISEGVFVDDHGTKYILADTELGREALTHSGKRIILTGELGRQKRNPIIEVTSYQLWEQPGGGSGKEDDSD